MECALCKVQYVGKAKTAFNLRLTTHRKDASNLKHIFGDSHFRKPGQLFNFQAKFKLIDQLSNIHTTNKDTLKLQLKFHEEFWIQKI